MHAIHTAFSSSYAQARLKFLAAAQAAGLEVESHLHPLRGIEGETLAMDVVRDGDLHAQRVLLVTSACHGIEGYCGSGVQIHALGNAAWREAARQAGVAVVHVHALNPHGFSHGRRVTHENVDINRNFHDFSRPLPHNTAYRDVHPLLIPEVWPPDERNRQDVANYIATHGLTGFQAAVSGGQYEFEEGLFFGGKAPTWSNRTIRQVLRQHAGQCQQLAWLDLHTGLGPTGVGERIYAGADDAQAVARARAWWGSGVTSIYDGSSTSALLTGLMWTSVADECAQAQYTGIALEYGTQPIDQVVYALRGDHWLHQHPEAPQALAQSIRQTMKQAFYVDTDAWREQVIVQAMDALHLAVRGLSQPL